MDKREIWIYLCPSFLEQMEYRGLCNKAFNLKKLFNCKLIAIIMCTNDEVEQVQRIMEYSPFDEIIISINDSFNELMEVFYVSALCALLKNKKPDLLIGYSNEHTKSVLSQVAYKNGFGMCADCVDFKMNQSIFIATRITFHGQKYVDIQSNTDGTLVCTVIVDDVESSIVSDKYPIIKKVQSNEVSDCKNLLKIISLNNSNNYLSRHRVVLGLGNGFCKQGDIQRVFYLARHLGIGVGVSKALVEKGWVDSDYQLGMSGKQICPDIYIAVGISGAIQHIEGIKNSKTIISVNNDPESLIFKYSDIGIVADVQIILDTLEKLHNAEEI